MNASHKHKITILPMDASKGLKYLDCVVDPPSDIIEVDDHIFGLTNLVDPFSEYLNCCLSELGQFQLDIF